MIRTVPWYQVWRVVSLKCSSLVRPKPLSQCGCASATTVPSPLDAQTKDKDDYSFSDSCVPGQTTRPSPSSHSQ